VAAIIMVAMENQTQCQTADPLRYQQMFAIYQSGDRNPRDFVYDFAFFGGLFKLIFDLEPFFF
jgi:hypothetical protein